MQKLSLVIDIEGLIGAGKSSIISECLVPLLTQKGYKVTVIPEPVDQWEEILPLFYENPSRWGYHFQTMAFHDRVRESQKAWKEHHDTTDIFITERGVISDKIFMNTLHEQGHVSDMEMNHYLKWWNLWEEVIHLDQFIYLFISFNRRSNA
jgi:deoxyadenosine/deoxycytidine kinase